MPIFEYQCTNCDTQFELLVGAREQPACPTCGSKKLEKLMSAAAGRVSTGLPVMEDCPPPEAGPCSPTCCRLPQ